MLSISKGGFVCPKILKLYFCGKKKGDFNPFFIKMAFLTKKNAKKC